MSLIGIKSGGAGGIGKSLSPKEMLMKRMSETVDIDPDAAGPAWRALSDYYDELAARRSGREDMQVIVAPEAGAGNPGFFMPARARLHVEGNLLPCEPDKLNPGDPEHFSKMAAMHGVFIHEVGHAEHTLDGFEKMKGPGKRAAVILEEIRMEAEVVRKRPSDADWMRAAADEIILRKDSAPPASKAGAAMSAALTLGRVAAGSLEETDVEPMREALEKILEPKELEELEEIFAEAVTIPDGDFEALEALGGRMAAAFPDDESADTSGLSGAMGESAGRASSGGLESLPDEAREALEDLAEAMEDEKGERSPDPEPSEPPEMPPSGIGHGFGDSRHGVRSKERDPRPEERAQRNRLAAMLRKARWRDRTMRRTASELPPGRLKVREAVRGSAERKAKRMPTARPWERKKRVHVDQPRIKAAVLVDVSGSMGPFVDGIASSLWVLSNAIRDAEGTVCGVAFGDEARLVLRPEKSAKKVLEFPADGGHEMIADAIDVANNLMGLESDDCPRLVVIVSDGHWVERHQSDKADVQIAALRARGCKVVQVGMKNPPVDHGADRCCVLKESHELSTVVGVACVDALKGVPVPKLKAEA